MPSSSSGGSLVTGANVVDGSITNDDIAAAAGISVTKLNGLIGNPAAFLSIESSNSSPHSLTTVANQKVLVLAHCSVINAAAGNDITLRYNGVVKDTVNVNYDSSAMKEGVMLMYEEIPGAGTQNVTVDGGGATLGNIKIIVIKLLVG